MGKGSVTACLYSLESSALGVHPLHYTAKITLCCLSITRVSYAHKKAVHRFPRYNDMNKLIIITFQGCTGALGSGFTAQCEVLYVALLTKPDSHTQLEVCLHETTAQTSRLCCGTLSAWPYFPIMLWYLKCMTLLAVFFFSGPLGGGISPTNNNKFKWSAGCFSHFLSQQKQFPPLNYIRKNPAY